MNVVAEIQRLNERELELNVPLSGSWHQKYKDSAWVFVGGLPFELSEGDVLCVLSQFGEIEDIHLVRDGKTGKSKGFAFIKFEDQRSTILAVDNLNGFKLLDRVLRVDHVLKYKLPKELQEESDSEDDDHVRKQRGLPGHAYEGKELASSFDLEKGVNVFATVKETHKEKKKRKREEKKMKKAAKKLKKIEKKQQMIFEEVQKRRRAQRQKEEKDIMQTEEDGSLQPSATGWRGRLEPSTMRPRRGNDTQWQEEEKREAKSYGGITRDR
ncbi:rna-binding motif x-linked 2 [Plasmopara halstedii]|uniref:Rna-binding motif x-linked 2 n=1 Tax=Plasmopara halstedii TaxID=4781 RepID=A0A0P1A7U4_PLAHL|nr:rna-binding motif x-linked 2 [Plasmopara halstedii]CEG36746.1 rna-binding motif x-linked 2 [Plasmopara halstedii]|eukprot:XP_024573115.1 rna-binding motif x-linked 2 [Plasmopara halstedii]